MKIKIPAKKVRVMIQGITHPGAAAYLERALAYGTDVVASVAYERGIFSFLGVPVFQTVKTAVKKTKPDICVVFSPSAHVCADVKEAAKAKVPLIICTTERVSVQDALHIRKLCTRYGVAILGPSSPGVLVPGVCIAGTMPAHLFPEGDVAIVARSSSLSYEAVQQLRAFGMGVSACVVLGADRVLATDFVPVVKEFLKDDKTKVILVIGEVDGPFEIRLAEFYGKQKKKKSLFAYVAGKTFPKPRAQEVLGMKFLETPEWVKVKTDALRKSGAVIINEAHLIGKTIAEGMK